MNPSETGPLDYHEEREQTKEHAAEFESIQRFLPAPTKADRRLASYGIEHDGMGRLPRVTLKPGEALEVRLLPFSPNPKNGALHLVQHVWPPFASPVKLRSVCAHKSDYTLVNKAAKECEACAAGVDTEFHAIAYALVKDKRRAIGLKFTPQNLKVLQSLIEGGVFDFETGRWVRLAADERWRLTYDLLEQEAIRERDFDRAITFGQPGLIPLDARPDKLHDMAEALDGWLRAGKPEPQPGQSERLIKLLPHCTLVPIPWGCKGPQDPGWQNVGFAMMKDASYLSKLDGGNIGLLCGRDQDAANKGLVADLIIIGLDADTEDFADSVCQYNPWLDETFAVEGGRGLKWFFAVAGPGMEACLQSTKIMQHRADKDMEVGDWLSTGKQGVVWGLHPSGKMYTLNAKPLGVIELKRFRLPKSCYLASQQASIPTARECYRKRRYPRIEGPILDTGRLQDVTRRGDCIECACPACRAEGKDSAGNNLLIWPDGRYKCAAYIARSAHANHEHNQCIYRLAGINRSNDHE